MIAFTDVETTDLEPRAAHLLEVAVVITDDDLVEQSYMTVVCKPVGVDIDDVQMPDVVREMHTKNGLLDDVRERGFHRHEAEALLVDFCWQSFRNVPDVASHTCALCDKNEKEHAAGLSAGELICKTERIPGSTEELMARSFCFEPKMIPAISQTPLAGSSIWFDKNWLHVHMPALEELFDRHVIDVSSLTQLAKRWAPEIYAARPKGAIAHRALADVRESIAYLRFYRDTGLIGSSRPRAPIFPIPTPRGDFLSGQDILKLANEGR